MQRLTERQAAERAQIQGELDGLGLQRSELKDQASQLQRRRNLLDEQRQRASQAQRPALDARLAEMDARSAQLDAQIQALDDQIAAALARRTALAAAQDAGAAVREIRIPQITIPPFDISRSQSRSDMRRVAGFMAGEAALLVLMGMVFWRYGMRRMRDQFERMFASQAQQMTQLQQSIDVVSIEVERISEGQRYVAKVLSEGAPAGAALGAGRREGAADRAK